MATSVDSNILLRSAHPSNPMHGVSMHALAKLKLSGEDLCILPQNVREFWNVATRPVGQNGLGFSISQVEAELQRIEGAFLILPDEPAVYQEWRRIVVAHQVSGVQVHDAYIAAAMNVHGIKDILTFNGADFVRYGLNVVDPAAL